MAGINTRQYEIYKIGTDKLKYFNWNISITKKDAFKNQELVTLFEGQEFRIMADKILKKRIDKIDFSEIFLQVVINKKVDFARAASSNGITVNGINYRRFVGTTGGLKNNTLLFCNSQYIDELNRLCECKRNPDTYLVPAKYEAYKALTCSASTPICNPNGILVVHDCITQYFSDVISLDDSDDCNTPSCTLVKNKPLENIVSDGFNLCTPDYMQRISEYLHLDYVPGGVCLRNAWFKGMLYPFPIHEFIEKYNNGCYLIKDIWGNIQDIRQCDMIATESSFKLWNAYDSIDSYVSAYMKCGYTFSVTKISPKTLEEQHELNYQYLQSYEFTTDDIHELCNPVIACLKAAMGGDYAAAVQFAGITEHSDINSWQHALHISEYMLGDPYIIDSLHHLIKKKIDDAKTGKFFVNGNYQIASGDPFALMQSVCGLEVTGLLKAGECYSHFWADKGETDVIIFRSPMTSHNNIRRCNVSLSPECRYWYQHMDTIMIINAWDSFCIAENGCDWDSDILFSTNNNVLRRRYRNLPAIECVQHHTGKVIITEAKIKETNKNGLGCQVGAITNHITSMIEVQSHFDKSSREYRELEYRIECGQLYQQNSLDRIKGIVATPMPSSWYDISACKDDKFLQSICAYRKPYFMIYINDDIRSQYKKYIKNSNAKSLVLYNRSIQELYESYDCLSDEQRNFLLCYERRMPVGMGNCAMNRICRYIEQQMDGYRIQLHSKSTFDYRLLKVEKRCTRKHINELSELEKYYCECIKKYKQTNSFDNDSRLKKRLHIRNKFNLTAKEICPNDDERMNIILDITYLNKGNRQFLWDTVGDLICARLKLLNLNEKGDPDVRAE